MRVLRSILVGSALAALLSSNQAVAQTADNFLGTWKLNVAKSTFNPGPPLQSNTLKIEVVAGAC